MTRQPWEDLVEAECAYRDRCAQLYAAGVMTEQLRLALADFSGRDMALRVLLDAPPETVLELLDPVFDLSVSLHGPLVPAREVLARLDQDRLAPPLAVLVARRLDDPDPQYPDDDYRRVAELLDLLGQRDLLAEVVRRAEASDNPDIREVAEDFGVTSFPAGHREDR